MNCFQSFFDDGHECFPHWYQCEWPWLTLICSHFVVKLHQEVQTFATAQMTANKFCWCIVWVLCSSCSVREISAIQEASYLSNMLNSRKWSCEVVIKKRGNSVPSPSKMGVSCLFATDQAIGLPASLPFIQPASLHGKNFNAEHYLQSNSFKPAVLIGSLTCIILYHVQWPWLWLLVQGQEKVEPF